MANAEAFRVFVAVYRAGSVSGAARERHLTQPAVSAALSALERRVGEALFTRTPRGMTPTERGKLLYAQVADAVDRLERVSSELRLVKTPSGLPLRLGCPPEFLHGYVIPRLHRWAGAGTGALHITFADVREQFSALEGGTLDAVLTTTSTTSRALTERILTDMPFVLIGPPHSPDLPDSADSADWSPPPQAELGEWLNARAWVSYSVELPTTRRFFTQTLGVRFNARQSLIAPDLRAVVQAVTSGLGASLTPLFAAQDALNAARVQELLNTRPLIPPERWRMISRVTDEDRTDLQALASALRTYTDFS